MPRPHCLSHLGRSMRHPSNDLRMPPLLEKEDYGPARRAFSRVKIRRSRCRLQRLAQAYSMLLASSPSKKVNISFSDSSLRDPISGRGTGVSLSLSRRGSGGAREEGGGGGVNKFIAQRPPPAITLSPSDAVLQHGGGSSQQGRPSLTSPTQKRVRSLSSASSLTRGRTAPLRAVCQYKRAASTGAVCSEQ